MKFLVVVLLLVNVAQAAPMGAKVTSKFPLEPGDDIELLRCPNDYAYRIPTGKKYDFEGHYFKCEDYERFYELIDKGLMDEAKKLLLTGPK